MPTGDLSSTSAWCIIPARLSSTRLEQKMLLEKEGLPLFAWTAKNVALASRVERVVVATDSERILDKARDLGLTAVMTRADHASGTDRVREALDQLVRDETREPSVVINVQGDEPDLAPADLDALVARFQDPAVSLATLVIPLGDAAEFEDTSVVKVVCGSDGRALYFSRASIPCGVHARADQGAPSELRLRHLGVYGFRPAALKRFSELPRGQLERVENLEQLRWLEAGEALWTVTATRRPQSIDTPADWSRFLSSVS